jgi:hypothetical protein
MLAFGMHSSLSICTAPCRYVAPWIGDVAGVCDVQSTHALRGAPLGTKSLMGRVAEFES